PPHCPGSPPRADMGHQVPLPPPGATGQPGRPPQKLPTPPGAAPGPSPWLAIALLALAVVWILGPASARAQEPQAPGGLFAEAVERGKLPGWANAGSRLELRYHGLHVIACIEDRER